VHVGEAVEPLAREEQERDSALVDLVEDVGVASSSER